MSQRVKALIDAATVTYGTQTKLAAHLGVHKSSITAWKTGDESVPDKHVLALARAAGWPPMPTALEVYKERLGKLAKTLATGAVAIVFGFGTGDGNAQAVGAWATDHDV